MCHVCDSYDREIERVEFLQKIGHSWETGRKMRKHRFADRILIRN